jgi:ATP-dependent DNA helicase RecQ
MRDLTLAREFTALASCLRTWPSERVPDDLETPHLRRLASCLRGLRAGAEVGWADLAVLIRQTLRTGIQPPSTRTDEVSLTVPTENEPWPNQQQWRQCGVQARILADGRCQLEAAPWVPYWLPGTPPEGADASVVSAPHPDGMRRRVQPVPADPFLRATFPDSTTDFSMYTSDAHRQAVRTAMASRPEATTLVNLPTGSGKSTVALGPAFVRGQPLGVSLVIVPTVALALDQERRIRELIDDPRRHFAYTHATPDETRRAIRSGIRDGTQTIVLVSPEAVTRSLTPALFDAARAGHLRYFVVDEAHLVDQWGTEFRPEFQAMAGLRRELLRTQTGAQHSAFRTLLMTATLPPSAADLVLRLFGEPGPVETVISNLLRPEPAYWIAEFNGWKARRDGLIEAVRHLPRPAIIYTTRPSFADERYKELLAAGFRRLALFTGNTPDNERRRILEEFRHDQIDVVVATSAFGLGVDQDDIRTVIHACIPETIDRYYQEVGRSGRDGRASISLVCWTNGDRKDAYSLAHSKAIGPEKGLERWEAMFRTAEHCGPGRYRIPVAARRLAIDSDSDENQKWNIRTLGLFVRAGLVELSWDVPAMTRRAVEELRSSEGEFDAEDRKLVVQLAHGMINESTWQERVEPERLAIREANHHAHDLMQQALVPGAPICELIAQAYNLDQARLLPRIHHGRPAIVCGGCPAHRPGRVRGFQPLVWPVHNPLEIDTSRLRGLAGRRNVGFISFESPRTLRDREAFRQLLAEALRRLVSAGIRVVIAPGELINDGPLAGLLANLHHAVPDQVLFLERHDDLSELFIDHLPGLPVAAVVVPGGTVPIEWVESYEGDPPRVLLIPTGTPDPEREDRLLVDLRPPVVSLAQFVEGARV